MVSSEKQVNPNKTIYVTDDETWMTARAIAQIKGFSGVSEYLMDLVRKDVASPEVQGFIQKLKIAGEVPG